MLLSRTHIIDGSSPEFSYRDSIQHFESLSDSERNIKFAQNAHKYNPDNHNVVVINFYNEAVDLINNAHGDKRKLALAKKHLTVASAHLGFASNGVQELGSSIEEAMAYLDRYLP